MKKKSKDIKVKIQRFNPNVDKNPRYQSYEIPMEEGMSVLNVLKYISENLDPTLAYYASCRLGMCGGCYARVNGKNCLVCSTPAIGDIKIEPISSYQVIKDLVVDTEKRNSKNKF
jgi:succinate dehydrogenase/fumarate reductase iron-sulfur protein